MPAASRAAAVQKQVAQDGYVVDGSNLSATRRALGSRPDEVIGFGFLRRRLVAPQQLLALATPVAFHHHGKPVDYDVEEAADYESEQRSEKQEYGGVRAQVFDYVHVARIRPGPRRVLASLREP